MEIIKNIEKIMIQKGITAYKLEMDTGIKQTTFQGWKRGSQPSADKLLILISYLEVSPNELFGYSEYYNLTDNDIEMLNLYQKLPDREQLKYIGRIEETLKTIGE